MVGKNIASVNDRIAHGLVGVVHAHFRTDTPPQALIGALFHLSEMLQVVFDAVLTVARRDTIPALLTHLRLLGVVRVRLALFDHPDRLRVQLIEPVGRVRNRVAVYFEQREVLKDRLLELGLARFQS